MYSEATFTILKNNEETIKQVNLFRHALEMAGLKVNSSTEETDDAIVINMRWKVANDGR